MIPRGIVALTILDHRGHGPRHQDWLFGRGPRLATWRMEYPPSSGLSGRAPYLEPNPPQASERGLPGRSKAWSWATPHRPRYRSYQGPVPGNRGTVRVIFRGPIHIRDACGGLLLTIGRPDDRTTGRVLFAPDGRVHRLRGA